MRLSHLKRDQLSDAQAEVWDGLVGGKRSEGKGSSFLQDDEGGLVGPFNAWLHSPDVGQRVQQLGETLRFSTSLPAPLLEIAILVTARHWRANFEWWAHTRLARRAGIDPSVIEAIQDEKEPVFDDADQRLIYDFSRQLLGRQRVDDDLYYRVRELLGESGLVDVVSLLGYYGLVSMTLNVFQVPLPPGQESPFED